MSGLDLDGRPLSDWRDPVHEARQARRRLTGIFMKGARRSVGVAGFAATSFLALLAGVPVPRGSRWDLSR